MSNTLLFEMARKPISKEVLAAFKDGKLDIRSIPKIESGFYQFQAWAVAIYGPGESSEWAFGTALGRLSLVLDKRTKRYPNDPGGDNQSWMAAYSRGEPKSKPMTRQPTSAFRAIAEGVIEELAKANHKPLAGREEAASVSLTNLFDQVYHRVMTQKPVAPKAVAAESKGPSITKRFVIENNYDDIDLGYDDEPPQQRLRSAYTDQEQDINLKEPPAFQINDRIRDKMADLLMQCAKDMLRGDRTRLLPLKAGGLRSTIQIQFTGITEEDGLPVATLEAKVPTVSRSADGNRGAREFATVKLYYELPDRHVKAPPGRKDIWADITFKVQTQGFELAREFAEWVHKWRPIHIHSVQTGGGDARKGAMNSPKANFIRTDIVINLKGNIKARLMLAPPTNKPPALDDRLKLARIFMLVRTPDPSEKRAKTPERNIEEDILIAATSAYEVNEEGGFDRYTLFGVLFHDDIKEQPIKRYMVDALNYAISMLAEKSSRMPTSFAAPTHYETLTKSLGEEKRFWEVYDNPDRTKYDNQDETDSAAEREAAEKDEEQKRIQQQVASDLLAIQEIKDKYPLVLKRKEVIANAIEVVMGDPSKYRIDINDVDQIISAAFTYIMRR